MLTNNCSTFLRSPLDKECISECSTPISYFTQNNMGYKFCLFGVNDTNCINKQIINATSVLCLNNCKQPNNFIVGDICSDIPCPNFANYNSENNVFLCLDSCPLVGKRRYFIL